MGLTLIKSWQTAGEFLPAQVGISYRIKRLIISCRNAATEAAVGVNFSFYQANVLTKATIVNITVPLVPSVANVNVIDLENLDIITLQNTAVSCNGISGAVTAFTVVAFYEEIKGISQRTD